MKAVDQTIEGEGEGNCFPACLASILEIPLEDIPNFCAGRSDGAWWEPFQSWCKERGFTPVEIGIGEDWKPSWGQLCWVVGKSPRGDFDHAVVGRYEDGYKIIHDPHPSRDGIDGEFKSAGFLIPLDPLRFSTAIQKAESNYLRVESLLDKEVERDARGTAIWED